MNSVDDINQRETPCAKCHGKFRIALPPTAKARQQLAQVLRLNEIEFIQMLREQTGCGLLDAKGTMQHVALTAGNCHSCTALVSVGDTFADCPSCGSLNIHLDLAP